MATNTYVALDKVTLTNSTTTYIEFLNISQSYTDLLIVFDGTATGATAYPTLNVGNNSYDTGSNYSRTVLLGNGTNAGSTRDSNQPNITVAEVLTTGRTNLFIHFMNYSNTTTNKTFLMRNNNASNKTEATVGLWRSTSAINRIKLETYAGTFTSGSTFSLYGILAENVSAAKATGGTIYADSTYWYHVFGASGTFTPSQTITCDTLVVGAGGGGGWNNGGGGGGGEVVINTGSSYTSGSAKTVTIGAGGVSGTSTSSYGTNGGNSSVSTITTALGGGAGGLGDAVDVAKRSGQTGGSGGGGCLGYNGGSASGSNTNVGGNSFGAANDYQAGGGGGATSAGSAGVTKAAGDGGQGYALANIFSGLSLSGITYVGSGGGGGGYLSSGTMKRGYGGTGAGDGAMENPTSGNFNPGNGAANSGGGAGGGAYTGVNSRQGGTGGSGLVIIRYLK